MQLSKEEKTALAAKYNIDEKQTGSPEYQIILTTDKIKNLTQHLQSNKHDFLAKRGVQLAVSKRKALLTHLRRTNTSAYMSIVQSLGLRG